MLESVSSGLCHAQQRYIRSEDCKCRNCARVLYALKSAAGDPINQGKLRIRSSNAQAVSGAQSSIPKRHCDQGDCNWPIDAQLDDTS